VDQGENGVSEPSNDKRSDELQQEIAEIRDNIGGLVSELDHRRHDIFDVGSQVRRHGLSLALGGLALVGLAAGGVLLARRRVRARRSVPVRVARIGQALVRLVDHPERQSPPPQSIGLKILAAAGAAAASVLARRLMQGVVDDPRSPGQR
jgi:hypothetical protein